MAPASRGIRRNREIKAVLEAGRRRGEEAVVVYVLPTAGPTRPAFVCGRKVGGAVERNRARRILREAWRALAGAVRPGFDVVFVARPQIGGAKTEEIAEQMARALASQGVIEP
jgi:ribonuclease P protein component